MRPTDAEVEAAAESLWADGRFYRWWSGTPERYVDLDPIGKAEFDGVVERALMAAAAVAKHPLP